LSVHLRNLGICRGVITPSHGGEGGCIGCDIRRTQDLDRGQPATKGAGDAANPTVDVAIVATAMATRSNDVIR
jgi:hypothetical protein